MKQSGKKLISLLLVWIALLTWLCPAEGDEVKTVASPADAEEWVGILLGEDPGQLEGAYRVTSQMALSVALSGGWAKLAASLASLGTPAGIGPAYEGEYKGYRVFFVPCVFSAMSLDLIVVMEGEEIGGLVTGPYTGGQQEQAASGRWESMDLSVPVPALDGELPGTLTVPEGEGPFPAVVLVHGSGPNDRDETVMNLRPFRDLAEGLAEKGVVVFRYDKRTWVYGERLAQEKDVTLMDETVEDAVSAVQVLLRQEKIDPERIWVLGHSLGATAIPVIDGELKRLGVPVRGYVMMAASARPLDVLMREQIEYLYSLMDEITPEQQAEKDALLEDLDRLRDPDALTDEDSVAGAPALYWKWLAAYDQLKAAEEINLPCLLLQGEEDYQVTMEDFALWQQAFGEKENWKLISYSGLTHPFTPGLKAEGSGAYARTEKVDGQVIGDIAAFILEH